MCRRKREEIEDVGKTPLLGEVPDGNRKTETVRWVGREESGRSPTLPTFRERSLGCQGV